MKNWKRLLIRGAASVLLVTGVLAGCQSPTSADKNGGRTSAQVTDDNRITDQVKQGLAQEPVYKFYGVDVKTFDSVVQLSGFANTEQQRTRAGELAQQVPGVAKVVNGITLKPAPPTTPTGRPNAAPIETNSNPNTVTHPAPAPVSQ